MPRYIHQFLFINHKVVFLTFLVNEKYPSNNIHYFSIRSKIIVNYDRKLKCEKTRPSKVVGLFCHKYRCFWNINFKIILNTFI